jgi:hypothetical protein
MDAGSKEKKANSHISGCLGELCVSHHTEINLVSQERYKNYQGKFGDTSFIQETCDISSGKY